MAAMFIYCVQTFGAKPSVVKSNLTLKLTSLKRRQADAAYFSASVSAVRSKSSQPCGVLAMQDTWYETKRWETA